MLSARVIPCLDVDAGRVVKGVKFKEIRDAGDPVAVAQAYEQQGADELVFLDITASSDDRKTMRDVVERTVATCFMPVTVGGGIRELEDVRSMLLAGADKVSMNTAAILNPNLIDDSTSTFGNQCIVVAIDAKKNEHGSYIFQFPNTTAHCDWHKTSGDRTLNHIPHRLTIITGGSNIKEYQFICPLLFIGLGNCNRITGIPYFLKFNSFDHSSCVYIETGNYAG